MTRILTEYKSRRMLATEAVKQGYATQGWRFLEVVGRLTTDALPAAHFSSRTARKITAAACTSGARVKKVYAQKDSFFLVVTMQRPTGKRGEDGDSFVLVFTKSRTPLDSSPKPRSRLGFDRARPALRGSALSR